MTVERRTGSTWKWVGGAVGGFAALLVVLGIVGAIAGEEEEPNSSVLNEQSASEPDRVVPTVAAAVGSNPEELAKAEYATEMLVFLDDFLGINRELSQLMLDAGDSPSLIFSSAWQDDVLGALDDVKRARNQLDSIDPPDSLEHVHEDFLSASGAYGSAEDDIRSAITEINAGRLTSATSYLESAVANIQLASSYLESANASLQEFQP